MTPLIVIDINILLHIQKKKKLLTNKIYKEVDFASQVPKITIKLKQFMQLAE